MDDYDLPGLYGIMLNFEESKELKRHNTLRIAKDPEAALVVTTRKKMELYHRANYQLPKAESEDEVDEETVAIKNELAFLTKKLETKKFARFKGKRTFNPKTATCYMCGITGHIAAKCKVKTGETSQVDRVAERAKKNRQKYLRLKKGKSESQPKE